MNGPILELRVALTTADYDSLVRFYQEGLGLNPAALWTSEHGKALMYEMGRGTLEIFDEPHAESVDQLETEGRGKSGQIRFALQVEDVDAAVARATAWGATLVHAPIITPWQHKNARLQSPDGLQITLFQVLGDE